MGQIEYKGLDSIQYVSKILNDINAKNIFIVCGNKSYKLSGAENFFKTISDQFDKIVIFSDLFMANINCKQKNRKKFYSQILSHF